MNDRPAISPPPRQIREKRNGRTAAERVLPVRNLRSITTQLHIGLTQTKKYEIAQTTAILLLILILKTFQKFCVVDPESVI
jgi:hypothetical protein